MYPSVAWFVFAVVTSGPELIAGSMPIRRNKNGNSNPNVVATIIAENMAVLNAKTTRIGTVFSVPLLELSNITNAVPPNNTQLNATRRAMRTSRAKTWLKFT